MGGIGSGRFGRRSSRPRAEEVYSIDSTYLGSVGVIEPNASNRAKIEHPSVGSLPALVVQIAVDTERVSGRALLGYATPVELRCQVDVEATPQTYGGLRWWWRCPRCTRRCALLYLVPRATAWSCRRCARVTYTSQALSIGERWRHRARKLYRRAGTWEHADYHWRPKGMHLRTFDRLMDLAQEFDEAAFGHSLRGFAKAFARLDRRMAN